ncbi:dihydropyrimidine dehydrogenase [Salipiger bermudensis HTCC2601]|uniref:Dihydropyrimidine dehydrogenase n=1 Tax=Salipiger bermudensis (strain DSM 26914 / JCM 13377 / KCTC 12554 / HTCC2601) TaxID=314265 RepID=Q0FIP6_SALBH|nr:dihydropyrimidine dehydrogenase [Salipiger bermudensis HTCC2601]
MHREVGYDALLAEVKSRGFHLIECGNQYVIICNAGQMRVHC